jgi:hypothetical protein
VVEHGVLKTEQLERIKLRDTFLNLNIVALGVTTAITVQGQKQAAALLVVPWITVILGWAYLSNDDKVTAIARHIKAALDEKSAEFSWETSPKGILSPSIRRFADVAIFLLSFLLPGPIAMALYSVVNPGSWSAAVVIVVIFEMILTVCLGALYVLSLIGRG